MLNSSTINYRPMQESDFVAIITLGNYVHGTGYLNAENLKQCFDKGLKDGLNANFVAYAGQQLVGFRISYSPTMWQTDQWYSPHLWRTEMNNTAYLKCNTVEANFRGYGIGSQLLKLSIFELQQQGAKAGVSHLWRQSPGNSAVKYFTKCGGVLVKDHPNKWYQDSVDGYQCTLCGNDCHCVAAEMIIYFD
ncbi:GNAT family N-acetyltransferase [Thalassotalea sp. 42_200_T64]|nr:GNAT family N-acetyltransferase [Thalassotalea sp. 42_200_T64]